MIQGGGRELSVPVLLTLVNGMIENNKDLGIFEMYCDEDGCGFSEEFDTDGNWQAFIDEAKANDWKIRKDEDLGEWFHVCPDCAGTK